VLNCAEFLRVRYVVPDTRPRHTRLGITLTHLLQSVSVSISQSISQSTVTDIIKTNISDCAYVSPSSSWWMICSVVSPLTARQIFVFLSLSTAAATDNNILHIHMENSLLSFTEDPTLMHRLWMDWYNLATVCYRWKFPGLISVRAHL